MSKPTGHNKGVPAMDGYSPSQVVLQPLQKGYQPTANIAQQPKPPSGGSSVGTQASNNANKPAPGK